ncbi:MAG: leucyl aminopeptidase [Bdellovibrionota bacterium]
MKVSLSSAKISAIKSDLLVVVTIPKELKTTKKPKALSGSISFADLNAHLDISLSKILKSENFTAAADSKIFIRPTGDKNNSRLLLIGKAEKYTDNFTEIESYRKLGASIVGLAVKMKSKKIVLSGNNLNLDKTEYFEALLEGILLAQYSYDKYKSKPKKRGSYKGIESLTIMQNKKLPAGSLTRVKAICNGTMSARDLVNMPAADCNPNYLVSFCKNLARKKGLKIQVLDQKKLKSLKAFSILSVAVGSEKPPYIIKLTYKPKRKRSKVISIVGKGVTFDSGGYSLKPANGMMDMKCDMSGAAAVIGAIEAIAAIKPNHEIRAYIPTVENMVSGNATRPGDIVKAMNGKTIEVLNTDAEGRLILADALCLAEKDGADVIVDLATLTGACLVALGSDYAAVYSTDDQIALDLKNAGEVSGERLWHMPLAPEYKSDLNSYIADMKNIGGSFGGSITAALFLKNFIDKTPWAHLDIAGPAFRSGGDSGYMKKGGVGFGVRTIVRYVLSY